MNTGTNSRQKMSRKWRIEYLRFIPAAEFINGYGFQKHSAAVYRYSFWFMKVPPLILLWFTLRQCLIPARRELSQHG
jgi:hypothetical protein